MSKRKNGSSTRKPETPAVPAWERWPGVTIPLDTCGGRYYFDGKAAQTAVDFFPTFLKHFQGEFSGQPFILEDWQAELIIRPLFGWKKTSDNTRRFRKLYLAIPKKNGKSSLAAGIALYLLLCDAEHGAQIFSAAADRPQAGIVFNAAKTMIEMSPKLLRRCEIYRNSIVVPSTRSSYQVLSADVATKHGPNIHGLVFDELHAQPNRDLYDTLSKGIASRRQPLIVEITTAGSDFESICREEHEYAERIISGAIEDETVLPVIFQAKPEDDWRSPEVWKRVNPSYGRIVKELYLEDECRAAIAEPRKQNSFKRLNLNMWTQQEHCWIDIHDFDECPRDVDLERTLAGQACCAGIDVSTRNDLTCVCLAFKLPDEVSTPGEYTQESLNLNYRVALIPYFYLPSDTLEQRAREDNIPYPLWRDQGWLRVTPGSDIDQRRIFYDITEEFAKKFTIQSIGFDPYNANTLALPLRDAGYQMVETRQGVQTMSEPSKLFEALICSKRLIHNGNPAMRWNVGNVSVQEDKKENIFPFKSSRKKRIDGVIAAIIALSRVMLAEPPPYKPKYQALFF